MNLYERKQFTSQSYEFADKLNIYKNLKRLGQCRADYRYLKSIVNIKCTWTTLQCSDDNINLSPNAKVTGIKY